MPLPLPDAYRTSDPDLFRRVLKAGGWSYRSLAKEVGCSKSEIGWIAAGQRTRPGTAQRIAEVLKVDLNLLFVRQSSNPVDTNGPNTGHGVRELAG